MTANEDDGTIDAECEWDGGGYHALATVEGDALTLLISHDGGYEWESGCALRSARASIGPDDIVVSREALRDLLDFSDPGTQLEAARSRRYPVHTAAKLRAALSQPHPAQEKQT